MDIKHHVYSSEAENSAIRKRDAGNRVSLSVLECAQHCHPHISRSPWSRTRDCVRLDSGLLSTAKADAYIVQELCESRGGRPGLSVLTSLLVSVDVKP